MPDFDKIEDTLFVPMLGRIYASENFPNILKDDKALEIKAKLPKEIKGQETQTQYTLMASAVRSTNMDRYIKDFMSRHEDGVIAQLGSGLETTFYRNDNQKTVWYEIDLDDVIEYKETLMPSTDRDRYIKGDAFSEDWIKEIRKDFPTEPILVTASGLFYYFTKSKVLNLFKMLKNYGNIEIVFDAVNSSGMKQMGKYMKQVGHEDAEMFFYVDDPEEIKEAVNAVSIVEEPYYAHTVKKGLKFMTSISMKVSDKFKMVKMVHINLN